MCVCVGGGDGDKQKANELVLFTGMEMLICCKLYKSAL